MRRTARVLVATVALAAILGAPFLRASEAASGVYEIRPEDSRVGFTIQKWVVFKEEGRFREMRGEVAVDRENPAASRVWVEIVASSLDTRDPYRDRTVRGEDFLNVRRYPTLRFESRRVLPKGGEAFDIEGDLTIRGVTRRVTVPVRLRGLARVPEVGDLAGFETSFTIKRSDYGVLGSKWSGGKAILSDEVVVSMEVGARRK
ncbi:MAG TPA: YceI family protein [Thermoanaerobaculia bacterium]|jgi:polyisoprenoid-binding protein YceI